MQCAVPSPRHLDLAVRLVFVGSRLPSWLSVRNQASIEPSIDWCYPSLFFCFIWLDLGRSTCFFSCRKEVSRKSFHFQENMKGSIAKLQLRLGSSHVLHKAKFVLHVELNNCFKAQKVLVSWIKGVPSALSTICKACQCAFLLSLYYTRSKRLQSMKSASLRAENNAKIPHKKWLFRFQREGGETIFPLIRRASQVGLIHQFLSAL